MIYQARYAHLETLPDWKVGDKIKKGDIIGKMGSTGASKFSHLHFDLIQQVVTDHVYRLDEIQKYIIDLESLMYQYRYFIDDSLFGIAPHISTFFGDWKYPTNGITPVSSWQFHPAFDVVPVDRHSTDEHFYIRWNRSADGEVSSCRFDHGYGNHLCATYEAA